MTRAQWITLAAAAALFAVLTWGLERRPPEMRGGGANAVGGAALRPTSTTSAQALQREALPRLSARAEAEIHGLAKMLDAATADARRRGLLEDLSGAWYRAGHPALAGHYAQAIAELAPSDTTWGIAATTYSLCLRADSLSAKAEAFCRERAVPAYENAVSLAPANTAHKVNLALHYADNPPAGNPMRGIRMLLDLNRENPDDVTVLVQLGRLALQTGQNDKARTRLERAAGLAPDNRAAQCLLAEAARRTDDPALAAASEAACRALSDRTDNL